MYAEMRYGEEYVRVVDRFNADHYPKATVELVTKIEGNVTMYFVHHHGTHSAFTLCKSSPSEFEQRLKEIAEAIEQMDTKEESE